MQQHDTEDGLVEIPVTIFMRLPAADVEEWALGRTVRLSRLGTQMLLALLGGSPSVPIPTELLDTQQPERPHLRLVR